MISQAFPSYAAALEAADFGAWHEAPSEASPIDSLFVVLHVDDRDRRYVVQGFDARELARAIQADAVDFPSSLLQLTLQYPFEVLPMCFADTARLLHPISSLLPLGTFLLSEDDKAICYRTMIPSEGNGLSVETFVSIMRIIQFICVEFAALIEAVATGEMTYAEAMARVRSKAEPAEQVPV